MARTIILVRTYFLFIIIAIITAGISVTTSLLITQGESFFLFKCLSNRLKTGCSVNTDCVKVPVFPDFVDNFPIFSPISLSYFLILYKLDNLGESSGFFPILLIIFPIFPRFPYHISDFI